MLPVRRFAMVAHPSSVVCVHVGVVLIFDINRSNLTDRKRFCPCHARPIACQEYHCCCCCCSPTPFSFTQFIYEDDDGETMRMMAMMRMMMVMMMVTMFSHQVIFLKSSSLSQDRLKKQKQETKAKKRLNARLQAPAQFNTCTAVSARKGTH